MCIKPLDFFFKFLYIRVVRKLRTKGTMFLNNFQLKRHFCRALARKNARTCEGTNRVPEQDH
jgi:hypothetical protein